MVLVLAGVEGVLVTAVGSLCLPVGGFPVEDAGPLGSMVAERVGGLHFLLGMMDME